MSQTHSPLPSVNRLLSTLSPEDLSLLQPKLQRQTLQLRFVVEKPGRPVEQVHFPEQGLASVVSNAGGDRRVETGMIGREGVTGSCVILGSDQAPSETFVQMEGQSLWIPADDLRRAMDASATLRTHLTRFVHTLMVQMSSTALANAEARLEERLARWLLMAHDRADGDDIPLVHEFIALMLGVRRAGVTVALQDLRRHGLISHARARITIRDRAGMEAMVGRFYGVPEAEYRRLFG